MLLGCDMNAQKLPASKDSRLNDAWDAVIRE